MSNFNIDSQYLKYFQVISPSEVSINREDIYYRDKYNDIVNYLKIILTNHHDLVINSYLQPNGLLLINSNPGTDILDYLKVISKNYYLNFLELNYEEIYKNPKIFFNNFVSILQNITNLPEGNSRSEDKSKERADIEPIYTKYNKIEQLIIINQDEIFTRLFEDNNLLTIFLKSRKADDISYNFRVKGTILIWISQNMQDIEVNSGDVFQVFDLFIKIPLLNKIERETILRDFSEKNPRIVFDIATIVDYTANWEVKDLFQLLKMGIFKHFLNAELNEKSNEITDVLINLIESGEYIPTNYIKHDSKQIIGKNASEKDLSYKKKSIEKEYQLDQVKKIDNIVSQIQRENFSEFMLNQLYENAASKNYNELLLIIDKLKNNEKLEENDKRILGKYPFILNDTYHKAQVNLEKAKKQINNIKKVFGDNR